MDTGLSNREKVAVITGGTSGVGLATARLLVKDGYKVYVVARNSVTKGNNIDGVEYIYGDVADLGLVERVRKTIQLNENRVDVLINSAGVIKAGGIEALDYADWNSMLGVNISGIFNCTKGLLELIRNSNSGAIVNVSSISSKMTGSSLAYSACKASVDMMTKSLAKELAKYGIRVNSVNPGLLSTGFQVHNGLIAEDGYNNFISNANKDYPLGVGKAEDIAELIKFLVSDKAKWITGSNYIIDGGRSVNI